jgi:hypothetical protein
MNYLGSYIFHITQDLIELDSGEEISRTRHILPLKTPLSTNFGYYSRCISHHKNRPIVYIMQVGSQLNWRNQNPRSKSAKTII